MFTSLQNLGMTGVRVAVALALPAIGEVPVAGLALVAPPPERGLVRVTQTLKHSCSTIVHNSCVHCAPVRFPAGRTRSGCPGSGSRTAGTRCWRTRTRRERRRRTSSPPPAACSRSRRSTGVKTLTTMNRSCIDGQNKGRNN